MTVFTTFLPVILTVLSAALPQVNALGCYSGGLNYDGLHGGNQDNYREVADDINTTCNMVANKEFRTGEPGFTRCSQWAKTRSDHEDCYDNCVAGCNGMTGEKNKILCLAGCDPNCDPGPDGGNNHINWVINLAGPTKTMTWETCSNAFVKELNGCSTGSEQDHDGFFFKIDPQDGVCWLSAVRSISVLGALRQWMWGGLNRCICIVGFGTWLSIYGFYRTKLLGLVLWLVDGILLCGDKDL